MKPPVAIEVDRGQMEDAEPARHAGGFADVDFIEHAGDVGQRFGQQPFPGAAGAAMGGGEKNDRDAGRGGQPGVEFAFAQTRESGQGGAGRIAPFRLPVACHAVP